MNTTLKEYVCQRCGVIGFADYRWQVFGNNTSHVRASCHTCHGFIEWAKQTYDVLAVVVGTPGPDISGECAACHRIAPLIDDECPDCRH